MPHEVSASKTTNTVPEQPGGGQESAAGPPPTGGSVRAVPFDRLLSVAVLTPAQASLVAVQLLDAAQMSGTVDGEYLAACLGAVTLTPSGDIVVDRPHADEEGPGLTELLEQLLQNARRLPAHPRPEQLRLLRRLEEATRGPLVEPSARARELEAALADTLGSGARQRLSGQLAALVEAFAHVAPSVPSASGALPAPRAERTTTAAPAIARAASAAPGSSPPAVHRAAPARHAPSRPRRRRALFHPRKRGRRVALVVLVVAAVLASSGYVMFHQGGVLFGSHGRGSDPAAPTTTAPAQPSKQPAKQPRPHRRQPVPTLAAGHAGAITGVVVQKAGRCKPGGLCPVKVTVHFRPASTTRPVGWKVGVARLCKRGITWTARTGVTAQAGWTRVFAHSSVRVPKGRSLALVALTTTPARAQSRPVPVTGSSLRC